MTLQGCHSWPGQRFAERSGRVLVIALRDADKETLCPEAVRVFDRLWSTLIRGRQGSWWMGMARLPT
jgi:hypothetical protein